MNAGAAASGGKGFYGYDAELEREIFEFRRNEYPGRDPAEMGGYWRWLLVDSAQRLGMRPLVWLYRRNNAVLAHQGAIPVQLMVKGETMMTGWFVETIAAKSIRGSPIGPMLIRKALEDLPFNLSLGQTDQMRKLQFAMGWQYVCSLSRYVLVTGYRMSLRRKLPPGAAEAAALAAGLWHDWRYNRRKHRRAGGGRPFLASRIERFTEKHDELWREMAETCACVVVRDSSYMNWKYIDRPGAEERFRCIELTEDGDDRVAGVVVAMVANPKGGYNYRRGLLVDFVVPLNRPDCIAALIDEGVAALRREGAQTVTCQTAHPVLCAQLDELGFLLRGARHQFLVAAGGHDEDMSRTLLKPDNWFLTLGDSDGDMFPN